MKVAIVYNEPDKDRLDSIDIIDQVNMVSDALQELEYEFGMIVVGGDTCPCADLLYQLDSFGPDVVFNLFEALHDDPRFHPAIASFYEIGGFAYTGAPYPALLTTTDKILTKAVLKANNLPTPPWQTFNGAADSIRLRPPWIVKPSWEDGSVGVDEESIFTEQKALKNSLSAIYLNHRRQPLLIEEYVDGREFNIPLVELSDGSVRVLPISEITFEDWPEDKPKIVGYKAKWDENAFEYENTQRVFVPDDAPIDAMAEIGYRCWEVFNLGGYARVDLRLDESGGLHVIEINANPCIAAESGYMRAVAEGGFEARDFVREIIGAARRRRYIR
ncbi:MAG TPA: ATP-grasp domain-containing protein [Syntrophales bacterium]|nr:ATP-grasp domain-containing protein [Syntrophales bacterium]